MTTARINAITTTTTTPTTSTLLSITKISNAVEESQGTQSVDLIQVELD